MKKTVIAVWLAVSVLCCACSKKDTVTSSEGGAAEETYRSSMIYSETSEEPTDPSVEETVSYVVPSYQLIQYIPYQTVKEEYFTFLPSDGPVNTGFNCMEYYLGSYGIPVFEGDLCTSLNEAVKEDAGKICPDAGEYFNARKAAFAKRLGTEQSGIEYTDDLSPVVLRADEKICTVYYPLMKDKAYSEKMTSENLINYDTATGKRILLSDVVQDREAFNAVAEERILGSLSGDDMAMIRMEDIQTFLNSDQIPFTIDYSGISLYFDIDIYGENSRGPAHIEYISNEAAFREEYFDCLPEDYVLHIAPDTDFFWDLDGDGKTESVFLDIPIDSNYSGMGSFAIRVGDHNTKFINGFGDEVWPEFFSIIHVHGQNFIYISVSGADAWDGYDIFEIVGNRVEFRGEIGKWQDVVWQNYDPNHVTFSGETYVVGLTAYHAEYSIDKKGKPVTDEKMVSLYSSGYQFFPCVKKELTVNKVDPDTLEKRGPLTLAPGTILRPVATDRRSYEDREDSEKTAVELFRVVSDDPDKEIFVLLELSFEEDEWMARIDGEEVREYFVCLFMGA